MLSQKAQHSTVGAAHLPSALQRPMPIHGSSGQVGSDQTGSDQTRPDQTEPDRAGPGQGSASPRYLSQSLLDLQVTGAAPVPPLRMSSDPSLHQRSCAADLPPSRGETIHRHTVCGCGRRVRLHGTAAPGCTLRGKQVRICDWVADQFGAGKDGYGRSDKPQLVRAVKDMH